MAALKAWLLGSLVAFVLTGSGRLALAGLRGRGLPPEGSFALSLALGAGLYSYLFFALGLAGVIDARLYRVVLVLGAGLGAGGFRLLWRDLRGAEVGAALGAPRSLYLWMLAVLGLCMLLAMLSATAPVSDWDSRAYHVGAPRRYLAEGRIDFCPYDVIHNVFLGQSMLSLWIMAIGPDSASQVLTWWFAVGLLAATYGLARSLFGAPAAVAAASTTAGFAFVAERGISPAADVAATLMATLAVYLVVERRDRMDAGGALLLGALAGFSCVFRMNTALFAAVVGGFALVFWRAACALSFRRMATLAGIATAGFLVAVLPWPARNYLWTGNPIYPFADALFHLQVGAAASDGIWRLFQENRLGGPGLWPLSALWRPLGFERFGTLAFSLAPLCVLFREQRRICAILLGTLVAAIVVTARFAVTDRFFAPAAPLAAVLASYALVRMLAWPGLFRGAFAGIVALSLAADLGLALLWHAQFVRASLGLVSRDEFLRASTGFYDDFQWMNANLPADARVLVVFREEYYLNRPAVHFNPAATPAAGLFDLSRYRSAAEFATALHDAGITHMFVTGFTDPSAWSLGWAPFQDWGRAKALFDELAREHGELVHRNPQSLVGARRYARYTLETSLYRLVPPSPPDDPAR